MWLARRTHILTEPGESIYIFHYFKFPIYIFSKYSHKPGSCSRQGRCLRTPAILTSARSGRVSTWNRCGWKDSTHLTEAWTLDGLIYALLVDYLERGTWAACSVLFKLRYVTSLSLQLQSLTYVVLLILITILISMFYLLIARRSF